MTGSYFGGRPKLDTVMFFSKMEHSIGKQGWLWEFEWMGFISVRCYSEIEAEDGREEACQKFKKDLGKVHKKKCHEKLRVVCSGN